MLYNCIYKIAFTTLQNKLYFPKFYVIIWINAVRPYDPLPNSNSMLGLYELALIDFNQFATITWKNGPDEMVECGMILATNVDRVKIDVKLTFMADITIPSWFAGAASIWIIFLSIKTTNLIAFKVLQEKRKNAILIGVTFWLESL